MNLLTVLLYVIMIHAEPFTPYPHLDSAAIAQAPQDEFAPLWNSFYRADLSGQVLWDKLYWAGGSGEGGIPELAGSTLPDRNMVFYSYAIPAETPEDISALVKSLNGGARLCTLLPEITPDTKRAVVIRDKETRSVLGEAVLKHHDAFLDDNETYLFPVIRPVECWSAWYWPNVSSGEPEYSFRLELTGDLKSQLRSSGLKLKNTRAFSVTLTGYASGILFDDGTEQFFLPQETPFIFPGREYGSRKGIPPPVGKLTPVSALLEKLSRIASGDRDDQNNSPVLTGKPVIYLYPEKETDVSVKLKFDGELTYTYPAYGGGWDVTAYPGGRIVNRSDGSEHYYLFWEGISDAEWSFDRGFCVPGADTETFLRDALPKLGLTPREYNDFITYWVPKLRQNPYNLIKFADAEYERLASLAVTPKPDTLARIHMVYRPLDKPVDIPPQTLSGFDRKGFTVVEWGGTEAGQNARIQSIVLKRGFS